MIKIKRVYEPAEKNDGFRILVDRLWPRGIKKEKASIDLWLKEIAPSNELRQWYHHEPEKKTEFKKRYQEELKEHIEALESLKNHIKEHKQITFVYASKHVEYNNAVVLREILETDR